MAESWSLAPIWQNLPSDPKAAAPALLKAFLDGRKQTTFATYRQGLTAFSLFLGLPSIEEAVAFLISRRPGDANKAALDFKNFMINDKYAAATINVRLAALRSLVHMGKMVAIINWSLEVEDVPCEKYRETTGPGMERILSKIRTLCAEAIEDRKASRDVAIIGLMGLMAMRRGEVVACDLVDLDIKEEKLYIIGKGKTSKEPLTVPDSLMDILTVWLGHRGMEAGPLFPHFRQKARGVDRLSGRSVGRITNNMDLGRAHGLRHSAITEALEENMGDIRKVARFSRHRNVQTVIKYDDNRQDLGGQVAQGLADKLKEKK